MKKIFLMGYVRKNLGDDLFIRMLVEKYPMHKFFLRVKSDEYVDKFVDLPNLEISIEENLNQRLYNSEVTDFDAYVYIGGSIFIETGSTYKHSEEFYQFIKKCNKNSIPFYYISCNYGPYFTQEYFNYSKKIFEQCTDVCFRDRASYDLFSDIASVRYAPDFVFNYPVTTFTKIPNSIGISVIDLSFRKDLKDKHKQYINLLVNNIKKYIEQGNIVYLYSFCRYEWDEKAIDEILENFPNNPNVIPVRYDGDIQKFLDIYKKMEYFICSRFHSAILSCIFKQKEYILSYSKKTNNVINDLRFDLPILNIEEIDENVELPITNFGIVQNDRLEKAILESAHQEDGIRHFLDG